MKAPTESQIQQAVMKWWAMAHKGLGVRHEDSLMAFPLQGKRTPQAGARLKAEGMRKGTADMFLAVPVEFYGPIDPPSSWGGLWIELKEPKKGRPSPEQIEFLDHRAEAGYCAKVCYGFDECVKAITEYLKQK